MGLFIYVYFMEKPEQQWMITGATPILGNLSIYIYIYYPVQKATCVSTFDGQHIYIFSSTDVKVINL